MIFFLSYEVYYGFAWGKCPSLLHIECTLISHEKKTIGNHQTYSDYLR